jgi:hypothetical protein
MRRIVAVSMVVALAGALSACGGSSYKGLSKAEFVKQAEAICKAGAAKVTAAGKNLTAGSTVDEVKKAYGDSVVPVYRDEIADLRALKPPKADRERISTMLDNLSAGVDEAASSIKAAKTEADLQKVTEPEGLKKGNAAAKAYGLPTCGSE